MLLKNFPPLRRHAFLLAFILVAFARTATAQVSVTSDLSTPPTLVGIRPVTVEDSNVRLASSSGPASDATSAIGPIPVPHTEPEPTESASASASQNVAVASAATTGAATSVAANNASARASDSAAAPAAPTPPPSPNATINLINLMVKRNLITQEDADSLIRQAQQEADLARAQSVTTQAAAERALDAQQHAPAAPAQNAPPASGDDEVRIAYVPDVVKKQITDQVTQNVMEQTREEHLADTIAASQVPEWVQRFHVTGDVRLRYEDMRFPSGNAIGNFTNFNSINTSATGFNQNTSAPALPQYNVDQDRQRFRLRARIGAGIDLGENFTTGLRIATGSDDNPVTQNQTFGFANNAQGGNFAKYQIWLDRAFIRYDVGDSNRGLNVTIGRFDNPFFNTSMMWSDDLGFDGAVIKGNYQVAPGITPFLTGGAFPVFNTDLNFSTNQAAKFHSEDKYLFGIQGGTRWTINKDFSFVAAGAFYDFENIQGKVSDPIYNAGLSAGSTDDSRPSFAQNGNTYIALRDYEDPTAVPGVTVENQYYGLASQFRVVALTGQLDLARFDPFHMSLTGEFIKNVAFDRNSIINGGPASNPGPQNNTANTHADSFDGGDTGYLIRLDLGKAVLQQLWDWNLRLSYRYVETDATVDGFTDSDFGGTLSGTNLKGYTVGGNLALSSRVWAGLRWMSADNVSGATFRNDVIQFDLNAKF